MDAVEAEAVVDAWLAAERRYVLDKWSRDTHDGITRTAGTGPESPWVLDLTMYLHRASVLGLDNPLGRQAAMKALAVARELAESVVRVYGPPPPGGVPSGDQ